jgi:hypothetical protein
MTFEARPSCLSGTGLSVAGYSLTQEFTPVVILRRSEGSAGVFSDPRSQEKLNVPISRLSSQNTILVAADDRNL